MGDDAGTAPPPNRMLHMNAPRAWEPFIRKLSLRDTLAPEEVHALHSLAMHNSAVEKNQEIVRFGDRPSVSTLLVEGFVARTRVLSDGRKQIVAIHIPGDFVDLESFLLKQMDHSVEALTPARVAAVAHADLHQLTRRMPHLTRLLWLSTTLHASIAREWVLSTGRRGALARMANLLCEVHLRMRAAGLCSDGTFSFPLTQLDLAEVLGLSAVHVNRVVQELRTRGIVRWHSKTIDILNEDALRDIADFDATYLHLEVEPR